MFLIIFVVIPAILLGINYALLYKTINGTTIFLSVSAGLLLINVLHFMVVLNTSDGFGPLTSFIGCLYFELFVFFIFSVVWAVVKKDPDYFS